MIDLQNLPADVEKISHEGRTIYLIGTAHVSKESAEIAEQVIEQLRPNTVAVELCPSRLRSLREPNRWKNTDIFEVIRTGQTSVLIAQLMLAAFQKKLGDRLNIRPGEEMMRAVHAAEKIGAELVMADREIKTTLKRTWASLGLKSLFSLFHALLTGVISERSMTADEINALKDKKNVDALLNEFSAVFPKIKDALISERDMYLAEKIQKSPGEVVVAVVGAGHVPGIKSWLGKSIDIAKLETIPPKSWQSKAILTAIPLFIIALIAYGFYDGGTDTGLSMAGIWFWATSISAAVGSAVALGHPLTIIACFVSAPFTAINPFLRPGWVGGLTEAILRKPRVSDFETVARDITSVKGVWNNRVSRILLLVILTNLFSLLGAIYGVKVLTSFL